jgi:thiamine kinase-like enzyme
MVEPFYTYGINDNNITLVNYFTDSSDCAKAKIKESNIIFFTGGFPDKIMKRLKELDLISTVEQHQGIIMGWSAGAMIQCVDYYISPGEDYPEFSYEKGLNSVENFAVEVHYKNTEAQNKSIEKYMREKGKIVYTTEERSAIIVDGSQITLLGNAKVYGEEQTSNWKEIGVGNTATVYEWEKGKVLKLFNERYPKEDIEKEFNNAILLSNMDFSKPKAYEMISFEKRIGIVYDRAEGETLLDWVMKTGDVQGCAVHMAKLHKEILQNKIKEVPNYKGFLKDTIGNAPVSNFNETKEALQKLNELLDGDTLCHGDFHPGNILIKDGHTMVIDFMNVCHGNYLYDVARTVFLVEYTPVPDEVEDREMLVQLKKTLANFYLVEMNVTRQMIQDYLLVISVARTGECPE